LLIGLIFSMAKNLQPRCKQCRREGEKLFLKGERCYTQKCAAVKRNYPPGQFGPAQEKRKGRLSEFGGQLREKQKAKKFYGILERQLHNYFRQASRQRSATGETLIRFLETRLDNVVFRLSLSKSRRRAKQIIAHGHILVNGRRVTIPSYRVRVGDVIQFNQKSQGKKGFANLVKEIVKDEVPKWLEINIKEAQGKVLRLPGSDDLGHKINVRLIVEYYSR